jgi:hypothetical protein
MRGFEGGCMSQTYTEIAIRLLATVFAGSLVYVLATMFLLEPEYAIDKESLPAEEESVITVSAPATDHTAFLAALVSDKMFGAPVREKQSVVPEVSRELAGRVVQRLRLVGILNDVPQRAVIEDTESGKSFYVREGDVFSDGLTLTSIGGGTVQVTVQGEPFELRL